MSLLLTSFKAIIDNTLSLTVANSLTDGAQIYTGFTTQPTLDAVKTSYPESATIIPVLRLALNTSSDLTQFQYACSYINNQVITLFGADRYGNNHDITRFFTSKMVGTTYRIYVVVVPAPVV